MSDVIHALATAPGRAAVAVVRMSGSGTERVLRAVAGPAPPPRRASLRRLSDAAGAPLDQALVLWMPRPASFTGEDCAELHLHGGRAVVAAVSEALAAAGSRPAEPGEFSRRAFENGRLGLTEAEGIADLVDAETEAQRRQALAQLEGAASLRAADWRSRLLRALAHLEAAVDFPDEDLPADVAARARPELLALRDELAAAAADRRGEQVRDGLRVALIGAPNAGKSSLLNALAGRDAAIVTPVPGATRDVIEVRLELAGVPVTLADTAGLRATTDVVEAEGVRRARAWASSADLRLWVVDATLPRPAKAPSELREGDWVLAAQSDRTAADVDAVASSAEGRRWLATSAVAEDGVEPLRQALDRWAADFSAGEPPVVTRERHRVRLLSAVVHLERAVYADDPLPELMADDVRLAARELERLTGRIDAEAVLGEVFSAFCIGK